MKAHLARYTRLVSSQQKTNDIVEIHGIRIDKTARRVYINGEEKAFTTKGIRSALPSWRKTPTMYLPRRELFREIWDMDSIGDIATVTVHIKKIREKIGGGYCKPAVY